MFASLTGSSLLGKRIRATNARAAKEGSDAGHPTPQAQDDDEFFQDMFQEGFFEESLADLQLTRAMDFPDGLMYADEDEDDDGGGGEEVLTKKKLPSTAEEAVSEAALPGRCWGELLSGLSREESKCSPDFLRGEKYLKYKMCTRCQKKLSVPVNRIRAVTFEEAKSFPNVGYGGEVWSTATVKGNSFEYRLANHTKGCQGAVALLIFAKEPGNFMDWLPIPPAWVCLRPLCEAGGTERAGGDCVL